MREVTTKPRCARAHSNIALIKYWGKRDPGPLNLPAVSSLSISLDALHSTTELIVDDSLSCSEISFFEDGQPRPSSGANTRALAFVDMLRRENNIEGHCRIRSNNNFPTAAGLASSASGFASLVHAFSQAYALAWSSRDQSIWARRGSGSASRSIFGGFARWHRGVKVDGSDSFAEEILAAEHWPLNVVVATTTAAQKKVGSTEGMLRSEQTSPFYRAFIDAQDADMRLAEEAISSRDFSALAQVAEHSCMKMHGLMFASLPPLIYWRGATLDALLRIQELRRSGVPVFFTSDAGPQIKAVCEPGAVKEVEAALSEIPGVLSTTVSSLGPGAHLLPEEFSFSDLVDPAVSP